jgi:hypothetical protein
MNIQRNSGNTKTLSIFCLALSFMGATIPLASAETFSIDGTALNTNNQFFKLDGTPIVSSWPLDPNDPDQQFEILSGSNPNNNILKHKSTSKGINYCLNAHYVNNGGKVNLWRCDATDPDQNFVIGNQINNTYSIRRAGTNFCVDLQGRGKNQQVILNGCNTSSNQHFTKNASTITSNNNANIPYLPFDSGVSLKVTTGYGEHAGVNSTYNKYAVDFGAAGKQVSARATRYGQVTYAGFKENGYGNVVEVRYQDGKYGIYEHLESIYVNPGAWVAGGQGLGKIGSTGDSTGTHLHYMESKSSFGNSVPLPLFADAPNVNFNGSNFSLTSQNPDNRRP